MLGLAFMSPVFGEPIGLDKPSRFDEFFKTHCHECHGADDQKGEIRLDNLGLDFTDQTKIELWQMVFLDQLNLNEMPPQKRQRPDQLESKKLLISLRKN